MLIGSPVALMTVPHPLHLCLGPAGRAGWNERAHQSPPHQKGALYPWPRGTQGITCHQQIQDLGTAHTAQSCHLGNQLMLSAQHHPQLHMHSVTNWSLRSQ